MSDFSVSSLVPSSRILSWTKDRAPAALESTLTASNPEERGSYSFDAKREEKKFQGRNVIGLEDPC